MTKKDGLTIETELLEEIGKLARYRRGWFNSHSLPAKRETLQDAMNFIRTMDWGMVKKPHVSLAEDGEINFWWDTLAVRLDLSVDGDRQYFYYASFQDGSELQDDGQAIGVPFPEKLLKALRR